MKHLINLFSELQDEIQLVAPEVYIKLHPVIDGKLNILSFLSYYTEERRLFSIDQEKLQNIMEMASSDSEEKKRLLWEATVGVKAELFEEIFIMEGIQDVDNIPANQYPIIEKYLKSKKAETNLNEIEKLAHLLRQAIEKYFSMEDILLKVGDHRLTITGR